MRLLLDTHVLLWFLREPERLPPSVLREIESPDNEPLVSVCSLWEIVIKISLNKLTLPGSYEELFPKSIEDCGLTSLAIESQHLSQLRQLPWHHRDPFDRMLVAQASADKVPLVSSDLRLRRYDVSILW